jgi:hypothetical protein
MSTGMSPAGTPTPHRIALRLRYEYSNGNHGNHGNHDSQCTKQMLSPIRANAKQPSSKSNEDGSLVVIVWLIML